MHVIAHGCLRAIRSGAEVLHQELLEEFRIDEAAEQKRSTLEHAWKTSCLSLRPQRETM
jgi:hypothetical protein